MRDKNKRVWIGLIAMVAMVSPVMNKTNALSVDTQNNFIMSKTTTVDIAADKAALLVSKPKKGKNLLKSYENISTPLSDKQLIELLKAVGFNGQSLKTAWAVAKAESNGRPLAFNGNQRTGDSSYGVFQINMIGNLGPDRREKFNLSTNAELFNPVKNAQIAYHMTQGGTNWKSWKYAKTPAVKKWLKKFPNHLI